MYGVGCEPCALCEVGDVEWYVLCEESGAGAEYGLQECVCGGCEVLYPVELFAP